MALTRDQRRLLERTSAIYTATITDELGNALSYSALTTLKLTLYDRDSGTVINSRTNQNVLNANNVTVDSAGVLTWTMQVADNAISSTTLPIGRYETHVALWEWTWGASKAGKHETFFEVQQLTKVPTPS